MYYYTVYGLKVSSELEIQYLISEDYIQNADITISLANMSDEVHYMVREGHSLGYKKDGIWFRNCYALFSVEKGNKITVELLDNQSIEDCKPFICGVCMALLFEQRNYIALHAATVVSNHKTILIAGYSGSGKSTLTTAFLNTGADLLSDDITMVYENNEQLVTYPAFPHQRLCKDIIDFYSYKENELVLVDKFRSKYAISRENQFCRDTMPICSIFILKSDDINKVELKELRGEEKLNALIENTYTARLNKTFGLPFARMRLYLELAKKIPVYLIKRPNNEMTVDFQMEIIKNTILA